MTLSISSDILYQLQQQARHGSPLEICGLLFGDSDGDGDTVSGYQQANNIAQHANRNFEIDPAVLIQAEREAREGVRTIIGYYHSHPRGEIAPSEADAASAAPDGRIWIIINGRDAAAWRATEKGEIFDRFTAITLDCG